MPTHPADPQANNEAAAQVANEATPATLTAPASPAASNADAGASLRIAFLGPRGTFTEQAVRQIAPAASQLDPKVSVPVALEAVRTGEADLAVVPIENSIEGGVNATIDALSEGSPLVIVAETIVQISFVLAVRPGTKMEEIRRVGTHPHAWAQCHHWMEQHLPGVIHVPTTSTAAAAQLLGEGDDSYQGVLCNAVSLEAYGLEALATGVADNPDAVTRFVMVSQPGSLPQPTGADKTTIQVSLPSDEAGALMSMLEQFSVRGVNLSRIESRPAGHGLWLYSFSIDIAGHIEEERVQAALVGLHRTCPEVKFLGSYPRVDGVRAEIQPGTSDEEFQQARDWVAGILGRKSPWPL